MKLDFRLILPQLGFSLYLFFFKVTIMSLSTVFVECLVLRYVSTFQLRFNNKLTQEFSYLSFFTNVTWKLKVDIFQLYHRTGCHKMTSSNSLSLLRNEKVEIFLIPKNDNKFFLCIRFYLATTSSVSFDESRDWFKPNRPSFGAPLLRDVQGEQ